MTTDRDDRIERLCMAALDLAPQARSAYVRDVCAGDEALRLEIESLLAREPRVDAFLATAALDVAAAEIARQPPLLGRTVGTYQILSLLGAGGMGEVYRAHDGTLKRDVAIKVLPTIFTNDSDRRGRFEREARVLASLNHPNIGAIYGLEDAGGVRALVLELVEGPTLSDRLARGPLPTQEALAIGRQVADALGAAHEKGVIHRDLKPANIKVTPSGLVKVLDFGLAKAFAADSSPEGLSSSADVTGAGLILGTVGYMSPEQARGKAIDKRTDIWAFGCVLFEMLTGRAVFARETNSDTIAAILGSDVDWSALPASTPDAIRRLLQRCLNKEPLKRLHDIADARIELDDDSSRVVTDVIARAPAGRWPGVLVAVGVLAAAVLLFVQFRPSGSVPAVVRFSIGPPESGMFGRGANGRMLAVSPNGTVLAFTAAGQDGHSALWLRSLDTLNAKPVPGTEGAEGLFWSPDSASVGFFAGGTMKSVSIETEEVRTVCDVGGGTAQASWSQAGVILFAGETRGVGGLLRVSAAGGVATAVTTLDREGGETGHLSPSFLPDGEHFLFDATTNDGSVIYVGTLASKDRIRVWNASGTHGASGALGTGVGFAPPGYVLFVRDGTLMALPFNAARLKPTGEPIRVAERVQNFGGGSDPFSVSANGALAYWGGGEFSTRRLAWFTRDGRETAIALPKRAYSRLALAPDGTRAVVEQQGPSDVTNIALIDLTRGTSTRFTSDAFSIWPLWSPDGASVIFSSTRGGMLAPYRQSISAGENAQRLFDARGATVATDWSADGRSIVYASRASSGSDIGIFPLSSAATPRQILSVRGATPDGHVSPDGRWITYTSTESGSSQVFVTSFPDGRGRWPISTTGGVQARWRPDGRELYFLSPDRRLMAVPVRTEPTLELGAPTALFDAQVMQYAVARDGRFLLELEAAPPTSPPITIVLNWIKSLKS